jgi:hypothetical protein
VQPILDQYAMGVIQRIVLKTVAFGTRAPQITGMVYVTFLLMIFDEGSLFLLNLQQMEVITFTFVCWRILEYMRCGLRMV